MNELTLPDEEEGYKKKKSFHCQIRELLKFVERGLGDIIGKIRKCVRKMWMK